MVVVMLIMSSVINYCTGQKLYTRKWFEVNTMYRNFADNAASYLNLHETVRMHPIKTTHIPVMDYTYTMILHAV
jgi:hypothetical protein